MKIGTKESPIKMKLQNDGIKKGIDYFERPLLHMLSKSRLYSNPVLEAQEVLEFNKLHDAKDEPLIFTQNLISNPHLKPQELKIGLALYSLLFWTKWGDVFITTTKKLNIENIGYFGEVTLRKGKKNKRFQLDENSRLLEILSRDFNININSQDLNLTLKALHQFGYITITEITPKNLFANSRKIWNRLNPNKHTEKAKCRAYVKHIRLNFNMENKSLVNRWVSKEELRLMKNTNK